MQGKSLPQSPYIPLPPPDAPALGLLLRVWLTLSAQSWGGGVATLTLIRQAVVERHAWVEDAEFTRLLALVRLVPGINILALTILIGRRLAGWKGIGACVMGLLLPSVLMTVMLTACYARIQGLPSARAALRGIVPATLGVGFVTMLQTGCAPLLASRKEGTESLLVSVALLILSGWAALRVQNAVVPILCGAGAASAFAHWLRSPHAAVPADTQKQAGDRHDEAADASEANSTAVNADGADSTPRGDVP